MKYLIQSLLFDEKNHLVEFTIEEEIKEDSKGRFIEMIMEIPDYIEHWDDYELKLFYEWIFLFKKYIPVNFEILVDEWIRGERLIQINQILDILKDDISFIEDIDDYNKCLQLLKYNNITKNVRREL
jgi:hypothetical protein